jgi:ribosome biogenesis GTPase
MTRDYSLLFGSGGESFDVPPLARLGWQTTFARQTDADEMVAFPPVRVLEGACRT